MGSSKTALVFKKYGGAEQRPLANKGKYYRILISAIVNEAVFNVEVIIVREGRRQRVSAMQ